MRAGLIAVIVTPAPPGSRSGNRITALRWAKRLRELGLRVRVVQKWESQTCDVLIALHAVRSHPSLHRHAEQCPSDRRIVALTGTDIYVDPISPEASGSLRLATRVVILQPEALLRVPESVRFKRG